MSLLKNFLLPSILAALTIQKLDGVKVSVKGHIFCVVGGKRVPVVGTIVRLMEEDEWPWNGDDELDRKETGADGSFSVSGEQKEDPGDEIEPYLQFCGPNVCDLKKLRLKPSAADIDLQNFDVKWNKIECESYYIYGAED